MTIASFLRSGITLLASLASVFICILAILVSRYIFKLSARKCREFPAYVSRIICFLAGVKVQIKGADRLNSEAVYIFTANHASQFDIFSFHGFFPHPARGIGKQELFSIPFFGHAMKAIGHIPIDRKKGREAMTSLGLAAEKIRQGASVLIFPEGTRSSDGHLLPFKGGAMLLAIKAGVPIVPLAIIGSYSILPKNSLLPKPGKITIKVGTPIETYTLSSKDRHKLAARVHKRVSALLDSRQ